MLSEAQKRAQKKWNEKNKDRVRYVSKRSTARHFIKIMNDEDIPEFEQLLEERKKHLST